MYWQKQLKFFSLLIVLFSSIGFGYPEMIRHNYTSCTACHVSPNGGGMLTGYGRTLSSELLSQFGSEKQAGFMHGFVNTPEWLGVGGDVRWAETYSNTPTVEKARFIFMQADAELAAFVKNFTVVATAGVQEEDSYNYTGSAFISRRHYVMWNANDNITLRGGKFLTAYGINTPDHMITTRRNLGWDEGSETYNLEASYSNDDFDVFLTGVFGRPENKDLHKDTGVALRASLNLFKSSKVGLGYYYGKNDNEIKRHLAGPYFIIAFSPHFYLLEEVDYQNTSTATISGTSGIVNYTKLGYEFYKGTHVTLTQEYSKSNFNNDLSQSQAYGLGLQYYPIPHVEVGLTYQKRKTDALYSTFYDFAWFQFHYYL